MLYLSYICNYIYIYIFFFSLHLLCRTDDGQSARNGFYEIKVCSFFLNKDVELLFVRFRLRIEAERQAAQSSALGN